MSPCFFVLVAEEEAAYYRVTQPNSSITLLGASSVMTTRAMTSKELESEVQGSRMRLGVPTVQSI